MNSNFSITALCGIIKNMKRKTSFSISPEALTMLKEIAERKGVSMASVIEILIREEFNKAKVGERKCQ